MSRTRRSTARGMSIAAAGLVAALMAGISAQSSSAESLDAVSIEFTVTQFTATSFSGFWEASGGIEDSGSFTRTDVNFTGSLPNSPTVGAFQSVLLLSGSLGTVTVMEELRFTLIDVVGVWQITDGAGSYEHVRGHGSFEFISPLHFVDSGVVSGRD